MAANTNTNANSNSNSTAESTSDPQTAALVSATKGFDYLFANQLDAARTQLSADDSPFHLLGLGVCAFLEAALGMEVRLALLLLLLLLF